MRTFHVSYPPYNIVNQVTVLIGYTCDQVYIAYVDCGGLCP